uniref:Ig-like domain-containing protein n=1 Tax=Dromaius novaehollandiae TaxID=8790 RepID=A0A8C4JNB5_DRONO
GAHTLLGPCRAHCGTGAWALGASPRSSEGLRYSVPRGSEVILDCNFTTNLTGNFTELFWLHEREESPPRLIAWHHESSCPDGNSTGNRFQSSLDLENHWSRLTISGLQESDSGWYQCERLGQFSGGQRGRGTNLTVESEHAPPVLQPHLPALRPLRIAFWQADPAGTPMCSPAGAISEVATAKRQCPQCHWQLLAWVSVTGLVSPQQWSCIEKGPVTCLMLLLG